MKKQTVSLLVLLLAASGFFFSCGNTVNKNAYALEFDSIQVNETVHLFGDTAKPACNLILNVAYASQSSDVRLKDSLNAFFLSACFGDKYMAMTPEEAVKKYTEKYVSDYRNDLEPMYKKDEQDKEDEESIGAWYSYYKGIESHVQLCNTLILTYRIDYNEYTGGAHGIYMSTFLNLDLKTLSPIRLDDLFEGDYKEALTDLLWKQLMADNNVNTRQELEDMGYLEKPHTSAGRIPSPQGYRLYVDELMERPADNAEDGNALQNSVLTKVRELDHLIQEAGKLLTSLTNYASVAITPAMTQIAIRQFEIIAVDKMNFVIVVVTDSGTVKNKMVRTVAEVSKDEAELLTYVLNQTLTGLPLSSITAERFDIVRRAAGLTALLAPVAEYIAELITELSDQKVYLDVPASCFVFRSTAIRKRRRRCSITWRTTASPCCRPPARSTASSSSLDRKTVKTR